MNKHLLASLLSFLFVWPTMSMEKPEPASFDTLTQITRHSTTQEFKEYLNTNFKSLTELRSKETANTCLHELSYPFSPSELEAYNRKRNKNYTQQQIARFHAFKVDLLLRQKNWSIFSFIETNKNGSTPGMLAARSGYLPVLARMMLSNPLDWALIITELAPHHKKTLLDAYFAYNHSPKLLSITEDLQVKLSPPQINHLTQWATGICHQATPKNPTEQPHYSWAQLDREQTKYLFECYLALDILKQYEENPEHPIAQAYWSKIRN